MEKSSESRVFCGGDDSPEVHDSGTNAATTQLIKYAGSPNEVKHVINVLRDSGLYKEDMMKEVAPQQDDRNVEH